MQISYSRLMILFVVIFTMSFFAQPKNERQNPFEERITDKIVIADQMRDDLSLHLNKWYPLIIDTLYGGYLENLNYKWELEERQLKFSVMQSRHIYTCSKAYAFYDGEVRYKDYAKIGFKFLNENLWDSEYGGFFTFVNREGIPILRDNEHIKRAYSQAFGIYGAVNYYFISNDSTALSLSIKAFKWLEEHSYDRKHGGYFQFLTRKGKAMEEGYQDPPKDQNSSIHLLEAFTDLYRVWKNELLRERLVEMLVLIRDRIVTNKGYLQLFFNKDWTHVRYTDEKYNSIYGKYSYDHISFGHDVETAYLMIEASEALGIDHDEKTHEVAKKMVDHSIEFGMDEKNGGLYDGGYYLEENPGVTIVIEKKAWWSQVEGLNTFLIMDELYPEDKMDYFDKFTMMWDYCKRFLIDHEYGGWYRTGIDKESESLYSKKGGPWTGNYHIARSMVNSISRLEK